MSDKLRKKLLARKKALKERSEGGAYPYVFVKPDTTIRFRVLPLKEDEEFAVEATQFYLGKNNKPSSVFSRETIGEACPAMELYEQLKDSDDEDDLELVTKGFRPRKKYLVPCYIYTDTKGKEIDHKRGKTFILLAAKPYEQMLDLFLDEDDEWGDFSDAKEGYDLKLTREGSGMQDTSYNITPVPKRNKVHKDFKDPVAPLELFGEKVLLPYDKLEAIMEKFIGGESEDEDDAPKKKGKKSKDKEKPKKKKKKKADDA